MYKRKSSHSRKAQTRTLLIAAISVALLATGSVALTAESVSASPQTAEITDTGCTGNTLPADDDGSTDLVNLPFTMDFFGTSYSGLFVNNNGNITFQEPQSTYTPFTIAADTPPIIAPFFADVDTRGAGSGQTTYGTTTFGGQPAFCVNWNNVGYFGQHTDKLNSFQLLLVDRSDSGAGDFDIIMNYDGIKWETGDASGGTSGLGGTSAGAGYSAGDGSTNHFFQFPGSLENGALLDSNADTGLVNHSSGSVQLGRYVFPVRNGLSPGVSSVSGNVYGPGNTPLAAAAVQACPTNGNPCIVGFAGSTGSYSIIGVAPGTYNLTALPPSGSNLTAGRAGPVTIGTGVNLTQNLVLTGPTPPPAGTTIAGPTLTDTSNGLPVVYWQDDLSLDTLACTGGLLQYTVTQAGTVIRSGSMIEVSANHFHATVPSLYPSHGDAVVSITGSCPGGQTVTDIFNIYIDPAGEVVDTHGAAIAGATVTLLRSDTSSGPFTAVPNGDAIMSPLNRTNPVSTDTNGRFGWDVLAGYYELQASKPGCHVPGGTATTLTSSVYQVPPAALAINLVLDCATTVTAGQAQLDGTAAGYKTYASTSVSTSSVTTAGPGELLVALVQADGPANATQTVRSVSGAGLTWTRTSFADLPGAGANEIWQAWSPTKLSGATVQATFSTAADGLITVQSFRGAAQTLGAVGIGSQTTGPQAKASITPQSSNSLVIGGGLDWTSATKPVPAAGQALTTSFADRTVGDWYWAQKVSAPTVAGVPVSVTDTVPAGDRWSIVAAEVKPAAS